MKNLILTLTILFSFVAYVSAQDITLPAPDKKGGKPLMQALNERQSVRSFTETNLTQQQLSDLLWAACGINRPGKRTSPTAVNYQEIDVYVALQSGLYLYDAEKHSLKLIKSKDIRKYTGTQSFAHSAPVNLVLVADMGKAGKKEGVKIDDSDLLMPYADAGYVSQNIYLYCASAGLGSIVRGSIHKDILAKEMGLRSNQMILLAQTVGGIVK